MLSLSRKETREIELYSRIARASGAILSINDLARLTSLEVSEGDLQAALSMDPQLSSRFVLESGYVLEKYPESERDRVRRAIREEDDKRRRAETNIGTAGRFARLISQHASLVAVGGTTSYLSAREGDDIDLFCVSEPGTMWIFMLKSLLLSRAFHLVRRDAPQLCFSFVMDEEWAMREFSRHQDALFARDVLTSQVIEGKETYHELLEEAPWMRSYFPRFYKRRLDGTDGMAVREKRSKGGQRVLNLLLYETVGSYVRLKAWLLNMRLRKQGTTEAVFTTDIGPDHLIYESRKYKKIRRMYDDLGKWQ